MSLKGFTLIEMMLVFLLIGILTVFAVPKIGKQISGLDSQVEFFNDLIEDHYKESVIIGAPVQFTGFKGSPDIMVFDGTYVSIPGVSSIQAAFINGNSTGIEYTITVYPEGICDYFLLESDSGKIFESNPLTMSVSTGNVSL